MTSYNYASASLMWSVQPYLSVGIEYAFGSGGNKDGSGLDAGSASPCSGVTDNPLPALLNQ